MKQNFVKASLNSKTATVEQRVAILAEQIKHPAYKKYIDFCHEMYGEHPASIALRDLGWQIETGLDDDDHEPPEGPINPRYGRIRGRTTYIPFQYWLSHNKKELEAAGLYSDKYSLEGADLIGI